MLPKIIIQTEEINGDKKVESQKSPSILYEDEFCRVNKAELIVKNCNFWATNKVIPLNEIRSIYYSKQNLSENVLMQRSRSRSCRRIPHSPFLPRKTKAKPEKLQKLPKSPSEKSQNLDLYDFLWAKTPELLTYYSSGCTNRKSLYSITVDTGKKQIGFPVARPEIFLDLIRVLLPYQIVIKSKCISEISPKAYRMILAGSAVSISNSA